MNEDKILWRIRRSVDDPLQSKGLATVILLASDRENAKNRASLFFRTDPDNFEVTPLTEKNESVTLLLNF